jgi:hypothetical protein
MTDKPGLQPLLENLVLFCDTYTFAVITVANAPVCDHVWHWM